MAKYQLNSILSYLYNGKKVVLLFTQEMKNSGFKPIVTENYNGYEPYLLTQELLDYINKHDISVCATEDEWQCLVGGEEIIHTTIVNPENEQRFICQWVTLSYAEFDRFEREYLVKTDDYYDWSSWRTWFIERVKRIKEVYNHYDCDYKEEMEELRREWDKQVKEATPKDCPYYYDSNLLEFDSVIEQAE